MPSVSEQSFESQFANLAYTFFQDRAPALIDYNMGFQVVDKDDEGTKGMGVFGLRIGKEVAYIPAFFINGEIKGVDMIYAVNADIFVPLTEDWVNYFLNRKPYEIGEPTHQTRNNRGIRSNRLREIFNNIPGGNGLGFTKAAAEELGVTDHIGSVINNIITKTASGAWDDDHINMVGMFIPRDDAPMSLPDVLGTLPPKVGYALLDQMRHNAKLAEALLETYEPKELADGVINGNRVPNTDGAPPTVEEEEGEEQSNAAIDLPDGDSRATRDIKDLVEVITDPEAFDLSEDERERLMAGERVVRDHRRDEQASVVYEMEVTKELENPQGAGVYDVLMADGTLSAAMVLNPKTIGNGRTNGVYILAQPDRNSVTSLWKSDILTKVKYPDNRFKEAWDNLSGDATKLSKNQKYILVNERGDCTVPFTVRDKITGMNGTVTYWVDMDVYVVEADHTAWIGERYTGPSRIPEDRAIVTEDGKAMDDRWKYNAGMYELERGGEDRGSRIIVDKGSGSFAIRSTGSTSVVDGDKFKFIKVNKRQKSRGDYGTTTDMHIGIGKFAKEMRVERDGPEYSILSPVMRERRLNKQAAWDKLVYDHGLRTDVADHLIEKATPSGFNCRIKLAFSLDPHALDNIEYTDPSGRSVITPESMIQTDYDVDRASAQDTYGYTPGDEDYRGLANIYNKDVDAISAAGEMNSKEVLDTSVLTGLLNVHDIGAKVDKFIPSLISGLDKTGRLLFMLYWHWDKFEEEYGKQDAMELEDKLKQVFENTGDLVIVLQQHSLVGAPDAAGMGVI